MKTQSLIYFHHANDYWTYSVKGDCKKAAYTLRNESALARAEGDDESFPDFYEYDGLWFPKPHPLVTSKDLQCLSSYTIKNNTGVCTAGKAYSRHDALAGPEQCCTWCTTTPFDNGHNCTGWTYQHDTGHCFNCWKLAAVDSPTRISGCAGPCPAPGPSPSPGPPKPGSADLADFWENDGPATDKKHSNSPQPQCQAAGGNPWPKDGGGAVAPAAGCKYEDEVFEQEVQRIVAEHNASDLTRCAARLSV